MSTAGAIRAGAAYVEVFLDDNRIVRGLAAVQSRLRTWSASLGRLGSGAFGGGLPGPLGAIAHFAGSPAGMFAGLLVASKTFASVGDDLDKMSSRVGVSVEFLSALSHAAKIGGTEIAAMEVGIRRLQRTAYDATRGLSTAVDAFEDLHVNIYAADGQLKSTEQLFMESAAALSRMENNTKKAALATVVFGRAGTGLLPMLREGPEGLLAVMEEAKRLTSPGDNAKPLSPGDRWRPTADGLNSWNEAAQYVRGLRDDSGVLTAPAAIGSPVIVLVKNQSGSDRTRFDVLGVDGVLITPSDNLATFASRRPLVGVLPSVADHAGRFCVLLEPVATGKLGRALFLGVVPARVYVNSHLDAYCNVMESKTIGDETVYLGSGSSGAQILWWEAADISAVGTVVWAVLRLGGAGGGLRCFEVKQSSPAAPAAPGSSVEAWTLRWNATTQQYDDPNRSDPTDLVVIDTEGRFRWLCYDDTEQDAPGSRGLCDANGAIVSIHEPSKLLGGSIQVNSAFVVTGLTSLYALDGGLLPHAATLTTATTPKLGGLEQTCAVAESDAVFVWDDEYQLYKPLWVDRPLAQRVRGTTPSFIGRGTGSFTVSSLTATSPGALPSGASYTITNSGYCIDGGVAFFAEWDTSIPGYRIYDVGACSTSTDCG